MYRVNVTWGDGAMNSDEFDHDPRCTAWADDAQPCDCHVQVIRDLRAALAETEECLGLANQTSASVMAENAMLRDAQRMNGDMIKTLLARDEDQADERVRMLGEISRLTRIVSELGGVSATVPQPLGKRRNRSF